MKSLAIYNLPLKSLSEGKHTYNFTLDKDFFETINGREITNGNVNASLIVIKSTLSIEIKIDFIGMVETTCDRCLEPMEISIETGKKIFVKFGEKYSEEENDLFIISEDEGTFDISWLLYEFLALEIPICHTHPDGECNIGMIDILNKHKVRNINDDDEEEDNDEEGGREIDNDKVDPRWEALKNILNNN